MLGCTSVSYPPNRPRLFPSSWTSSCPMSGFKAPQISMWTEEVRLTSHVSSHIGKISSHLWGLKEIEKTTWSTKFVFFWSNFTALSPLHTSSGITTTRWFLTSPQGKQTSISHSLPVFYIIFHLRGGITVLTETGRETQSHLIIRNARPSDSGTYTCKPSIFTTAAVRLHVLTGSPILPHRSFSVDLTAIFRRTPSSNAHIFSGKPPALHPLPPLHPPLHLPGHWVISIH